MGWIDKNINKDVADYLFNIKLNCMPKRIGMFQRDLRPDVTIDFDNLEEELEQTPEMFAFWSQLFAEQKAKVAKLIRQREITRGYVRSTMLKEAREQGTTLRAEDLKEIINSDKYLVEIDKEIIIEKRKEDKVRAVVDALRLKSEHLRSLSGFKREEKKNAK
jgi:hypothetical protein